MSSGPFDLQVLLPIHNEAETIERTIREIYRELSSVARVQFLLCEDGSSDNTQQILKRTSLEIPAKLCLSHQRKGYSRAVREGMQECDAPFLLCLDGDGQCDPRDFRAFWEARESADILVGWRVHRADSWMRRAMSGGFYLAWKALYGAPLHDPSCPFVLARREVIQDIAPRMGAMREGFWWEFTARAFRLRYSIRELSIHHRSRTGGETQVYRLGKLPGIGYRHFRALFSILNEARH